MKIEKNVPIPAKRHRSTSKHYNVLKSMEIGDCVSFKRKDDFTRFCSTSHRVAKETGAKFMTRTGGNDFRVWRIS